jgi:hypothetical protein
MSYNALSQKATSISPPYRQKIAEDDAFWEDSPFDWIRRLPSRTRGTIGQDLARSVFGEYGYAPSKRQNYFEVRDVDIISRSSMLWEGNEWRFQQVRDTPFEFLFCLGLYPNSASAWLIPKDELYLDDGSLTERAGWGRQHGGKSGNEDAWLIVSPNSIPPWLGDFGGDISRIAAVFNRLLPQRPVG